MPNELIMNLATVYMNCKKGTTTVWDADCVSNVIELLNAISSLGKKYGLLVCIKSYSAFKENEKYLFYNEAGYNYIIVNKKSYKLDAYTDGTYRIIGFYADEGWEDTVFKEVGECQYQMS